MAQIKYFYLLLKPYSTLMYRKIFPRFNRSRHSTLKIEVLFPLHLSHFLTYSSHSLPSLFFLLLQILLSPKVRADSRTCLSFKVNDHVTATSSPRSLTLTVFPTSSLSPWFSHSSALSNSSLSQCQSRFQTNHNHLPRNELTIQIPSTSQKIKIMFHVIL